MSIEYFINDVHGLAYVNDCSIFVLFVVPISLIFSRHYKKLRPLKWFNLTKVSMLIKGDIQLD